MPPEKSVSAHKDTFFGCQKMTIAEFFVKTAKIAKFNSISVSLSKLVESEARILDFYECIDDVDSCLRCDTPFQNCRKHVEAAFSKGNRINRTVF